jgi:hypothetical protein
MLFGTGIILYPPGFFLPLVNTNAMIPATTKPVTTAPTITKPITVPSEKASAAGVVVVMMEGGMVGAVLGVTPTVVKLPVTHSEVR